MFTFNPYIDCRLTGDDFDGNFSNGLSMTHSETWRNLTAGDDNTYTDAKGHHFTLKAIPDKEAARYSTVIRNDSAEPISIEMISSFACKLGEFDKLWRLQSFWSAEGKIKVDSLVDLHMLPSWSGYGLRSEKFFNLGSLPVRKYFPFAALENSKTGEFLGIMLSWAGSWQFELMSSNREYYLTCGLADYDTGHFMKTLQPGESFETPQAIVAVGNSFEDVCRKLITAQHPDISPVDEGMPIIFNEFCTTWGNPSEENLRKIVSCLKGKDLRYLVIDCGWYKISSDWGCEQGEWEPNAEMFPNGLKSVCDEIRAAGMIPGIWYEMEVIGRDTEIYDSEKEHMLHRNGCPISTDNRRFWDMNDPWVIDYLTEKLIKRIKDCGIGYLKVDYNDSIGLGCDGAESLGEGLRRQIEGSVAFFKKIKQEIPELVIECCSSGGHRLNPQMLEIVSQASFSDAHETEYIPIIAANLHRVMMPKQSQIWAVLRANDSDTRLQYSLINTLLGRMCLSGDIYDLTEAQWKLVEDGMAFYKKASDIIEHGDTVYNVCTAEVMVDPHGNQLVLRKYGNRTLAVAHRFADSAPVDMSFAEGKTILETYGNADRDFSAQAWIVQDN